ncbi:MAG: hypothetical protein PHO78_06395 [Methanomicrobium sp.]|nr:hypothetical protein [Methanomicrobium sp.]
MNISIFNATKNPPISLPIILPGAAYISHCISVGIIRPIKRYIKDITTPFFTTPDELADISTIRLIIYTDSHESLLVFDRGGISEGVFLSNDIHAVCQSKTILKNIKEIKG